MRFPAPVQIGSLNVVEAERVRALALAAHGADGVAPLSEQVLLTMGIDSTDLTQAITRTKNGTVTGYVQVDRGGPIASAELVVHPDYRRRGIGTMLWKLATRDATIPARSGQPGDHVRGLHGWAHGNIEAAQLFAQHLGLSVVRELQQWHRPLSPMPVPTPPAGYRVAAISPGEDQAQQWVALNAAAFADHPEQGRLTVADFAARQTQDWYDPAGLLLIYPERSQAPVGYVWTKISPQQSGLAPEGEIYAIGVHPDHHGRGLGAFLLECGLGHLSSQGVNVATLYVDATNHAATRLYARHHFTLANLDVQYAATTLPTAHRTAKDATMGP